jgi:lysophospholipase L1-like esterase
MFHKITAVGDCNTLGANALAHKGYPERFGAMANAEVVNLGHTMATTREGIHLLQDHIGDADCVLIQFGLVDSYKTFKHSPYVLYYPDGFFRKQLRSMVKKYKKICRSIGLNSLFGEVNVVAIEEYERNLREMVELALPRTIVLLETIPNRQQERNDEIRRYNKVLDKICNGYEQCFKVELYDLFIHRLSEYYQDDTHCNQNGHDCIARTIRERLRQAAALPPIDEEGG